MKVPPCDMAVIGVTGFIDMFLVVGINRKARREPVAAAG
jgi:hypothetical protein